jgi:hypothetical protein
MENYINATCITDLEGYICPITKFVSIPNIGDKVKTFYGDKVVYLKVLEILHVENDATKKPYIFVKLG